MAFWRVRGFIGREWQDTWFGAEYPEADPPPKLTLDQAKAALTGAKASHPHVKYHLKKYEDNEP